MNVYLVNLSHGLAGIEKRFANLFRLLRERGRVRPHLVVPRPLEILLRCNGLLLEEDRGDVISIPEPLWMTRVAERFGSGGLAVPMAVIRSRLAAHRHARVWASILDDPSAVLHIGMNCSALKPPDVPAVYECVDSTLTQLESRHFQRAATRRCVVHCQTERIRSALEDVNASRRPSWRTVVGSSYFAHYDDEPPIGRRDPARVVFVGRLAPEKNPLMFLEAIAQLRDRGVDCRASVLGVGPLRAQCSRMIERYSLTDRVQLGFVSRPNEVLRRSGVFVSLQDGDNYGSQSLLEAMGSGCAVVASDVGQTFEIVTDEIGLRIPLNATAVADALATLLRDRARARRLGDRAEEVARTQYSSERYAELVEGLYAAAVQYHQHGAGAHHAVACSGV